MNTNKMPVGKTNLAKSRAIHIDKVDDSGWQARFSQDAHEHLGSIHLGIRGFPYYHITAQGSRSGKIAPDSRKIKRSNCQHKSFQRTILHTVMHTRTTDRLLPVYFA